MLLHRVSRAARGTACSVLVLVTLAACGGGSESATDSTPTDSAAAAPAGGAGGAGGGMPGAPGASGTIAAVSGSTLQVQSESSGQVAVSWTDATTFSEQVAGTLADVAVGSCVMVQSAAEAEEGSPVTATAVRISEAQDGECTGGFGGGPGGGERPEGMPTDLPTDLPTDRPTDMPGGGRGFGGGTFGAVTAVSATGFTVEAPDSSVEVTVAAATTYATTATADASAVEVGRCATAQGEADDTGAVTATRISVSDPVDGACSSGRGFGGPPADGTDS